jgi:hypothetical protein
VYISASCFLFCQASNNRSQKYYGTMIFLSSAVGDVAKLSTAHTTSAISVSSALVQALPDESGWTPLLWASGGHYFRDSSVLRLLLEHGADINVGNQFGKTPLYLTSFNGALVAGGCAPDA